MGIRHSVVLDRRYKHVLEHYKLCMETNKNTKPCKDAMIDWIDGVEKYYAPIVVKGGILLEAKYCEILAFRDKLKNEMQK
jgi:hypothetical protein